MAIGGLSGAAFGGASALSTASNLAAVSATPQTAAEKAKAKADAAAASQASMLADVRKKGIYAWAQEQKLAALKEKIRQQILTERHQSEDSIAGMSPADRDSAESDITAEITQRLKEAMQAAMEGEAKEAAAQGKPPKPMIIDISV